VLACAIRSTATVTGPLSPKTLSQEINWDYSSDNLVKKMLVEAVEIHRSKEADGTQCRLPLLIF